MLCGDCEKHFYHDAEYSVGYLRLKTRLLSLAREDRVDQTQLTNLESDLDRYEQAVLQNEDSAFKAPCPWYRGDLSNVSWQPPGSFENQCFIGIWDRSRAGENVELSARKGCPLCRRLCAILSHMPEFGHIKTVRFESWLHLHPITFKPSHIRFLARKPFHHEWLCLWLTENGATDLKFLQPRGDYTGDIDCMDFLSRSLETCIHDHPSCQVPNPENWIPTRLLDVRPTTAVDSVRLIERYSVLEEHNHKAPPYLTLSHVWGDEQFFTLTKDNITELNEGIKLSLLPLCFQHAIEVTRRLNIRYIWIDSLCIKQDAESSDDWRAEAITMDKVYQHGLCNIAACMATNSGEGLFDNRDAILGAPFRFEWEWLDHASMFTAYFDWFDIVTKYSPLYRRGWVVQERLISPRTMHFSTFPFWECSRMVTCETYPVEAYAQKYQWLPLPEKGIPISSEPPEETWLRIIEHYSNCELTRFSDKLIALSGVAKMFSPHMGGDYHAGLWESRLIQDLLWQVRKHASGGETSAERPLEYVAPSWSWASIDGPIDARRFEVSESFARVIEVRIESPDQHRFGQLTGGTLKIEGVLFETPALWALASRQAYGSSHNFDEWALSFDDGAEISRGDPRKQHFIPLILSTNASDMQNLTVCGIIVEKINDSESTFRRLGFAVVDEEDGGIANTGWFLKRWRPPPWPNEDLSVVDII